MTPGITGRSGRDLHTSWDGLGLCSEVHPIILTHIGNVFSSLSVGKMSNGQFPSVGCSGSISASFSEAVMGKSKEDFGQGK